MNRIFLTLASIIILGTSLFGQSQNIQVSLLTQDTGDELYAFFGHTAIRIKDDSIKLDQVYNYGTFDFNTPNFYLRFIKGDLNYCLSIDSYDFFIYISEETKRTIYEQVLNLTYEEKVNMLVALETCYNTDARYYRYDFLRNNCATKIRDIIEEATKNRIDFNEANYSGQTFRQLLKPYVDENYWLNLGINILMGIESDVEANPTDYMFLPIYIQGHLSQTTFVSEESVLLDASPPKIKNSNFSYITPWILISILIGLSFWGKTRKVVLYIVCIIFGLMGILLLFLNIYSLHPALGNNLNVLWTLPALFILFFRKKKINDYIKLAYILIIALYIGLQGIIPQDISSTYFPWMILIIAISLLDLPIINNALNRRRNKS